MDMLEFPVLTDRRSKLRDNKKHTRGDHSMMVNLNALNKWVPTAGTPAQTRPVCLCLGVALRSSS